MRITVSWSSWVISLLVPVYTTRYSKMRKKYYRRSAKTWQSFTGRWWNVFSVIWKELNNMAFFLTAAKHSRNGVWRLFRLRPSWFRWSKVHKWLTFILLWMFSFSENWKKGLVALSSTEAEMIRLIEEFREQKSVIKLLDKSNVVGVPCNLICNNQTDRGGRPWSWVQRLR